MSKFNRFKSFLVTITNVLATTPMMVHAGLPATQSPSRGEGMNLMQTIQNFGYDGFMLVGLVVLGAMMVGVAYHAYGTYHDIHEGRKKWRDLGLTAVVGACLIAVGIYLVTKATNVL